MARGQVAPSASCYNGAMSMRILFVVHDFLPQAVAGTEILVARLGQALSKCAQVTIFCTRRNPERPQYGIMRETVQGLDVIGMVQNYPHGPLRRAVSDPGAERVFAGVLEELRPDVVHFHHLAFLPLSLPRIAAEKRAATIFTLHDFYLACPTSGRIVDHPDGTPCQEPSLQRCAECHAHHRHQEGGLEQLAQQVGQVPFLPPGWPFRLFRRLPHPVRTAIRKINLPGSPDPPSALIPDVAAWRHQVNRVFQTVDRFVSPSRFLGEWFLARGLPREKLRILPNPSPTDLGVKALPPWPPLRLLFLGTPAPHKGLEPLVQAVARLQPRVDLEVCGDMDVFPRYTAQVRRAASAHVRFSGPCPPASIGEAFARNHLLVLPSRWPENAPLTVLEAHACGRPVLAPRIGGIPEYVRDAVDGLLYPPEEASGLYETVARLAADPALVQRLAAAARPHASPERHAKQTMDLYLEVLRRR